MKVVQIAARVCIVMLMILLACAPKSGTKGEYIIPNSNGPLFGGGSYFEGYSYTKIRYGVSDYLVFYKRGDGYETGYALAVVNVTKDSLDITLLRKELEKQVKTEHANNNYRHY